MRFNMITLTYDSLYKMKIYDNTKKFTLSKYLEWTFNGRFNYGYTFSAQTSCICAHIMRVWKPKITKCPFWKININCYSATENIEKQEHKEGDIYIVNAIFDYKDYFKLNNIGKKKFILDIIEDKVTKVLEKYELDTEGFKKACGQVRADNYNNEYVVAKKRNVNGLTAEVVVVHDVLSCTLYFCLKDKKKNILTKQEFFKIEPTEIFIGYHLSKTIEWIEDDTVARYITGKGKQFSLSIENLKIEYEQLIALLWKGNSRRWLRENKKYDRWMQCALAMVDKTPDLNE